MSHTDRRAFYFIRHGETDWNRDGFYQGWNDVPLNETGRRQAVHLAAGLTQLGDVTVFVSTLKRATETARLIFGNEASLELLDDLREASSVEAANYVLAKNNVSPLPSFERLPSGSEEPEQFLSRVDRALGEVFSATAGSASTPVIVAHGGVCTALCELLQAPLPMAISNGCLLLFEPTLDRRFAVQSQDRIFALDVHGSDGAPAVNDSGRTGLPSTPIEDCDDRELDPRS